MGAIQTSKSVAIASGQSLSAAVAIGSGVPVAIQMPAAWTAASLTFQASHDGVTFGNVINAGSELEVTAAASQWVALDATPFAGARFCKVRSGTSGTPVNQAGDRVLTLITRRLADE